MRLGVCAGLGLFCMLSAVILMIFVEIGQIAAGQTVLRHLRMTTIDTTNFGIAVATLGADTSNLYGVGVKTGDGQGLRRFYEYGLWAHCEANAKGTTNDAWCSGNHWASEFKPAQDIIADTPQAAQAAVYQALPSSTFTASDYLGRFSKAAFYLLFIGTCVAGISLFLGFVAHRFAFLLSAVLAFLAFLLLGVGAAIWTVILVKLKHALNGATVGGQPLGITASYGNGLWLSWAACLASLLSTIPFCLACCFGRGSSHDDFEEKNYDY